MLVDSVLNSVTTLKIFNFVVIHLQLIFVFQLKDKYGMIQH